MALAPFVTVLFGLLVAVFAKPHRHNQGNVYHNPDEIPTFEINLDLPPRERFKKQAQYYRLWFNDHHAMLKIARTNEIWTPEQLERLLGTFSEETIEELKGLVEGLDHPHADLETFKILQIQYEMGLTMAFANQCAGIVATKADGTTIHGRNLDLGADYKWTEKIAHYVEYTRGGEKVARGIAFFGTVGIHTGAHLGANEWTIEQNTRPQNVTGPEWVAGTLKALEAGGLPNQLLTRKIVLETDTFVDAVEKVSTAKWLAPQYFVLAGATEFQGAVITVGRAEPAGGFYDIQMLNKAAGKWCLVQTNDEPWEESTDDRRPHAELMMKLQKEKFGIVDDNVMIALRSMPTCNPNTLFSWVITPSTDLMLLDMGDCANSPLPGER